MYIPETNSGIRKLSGSFRFGQAVSILVFIILTQTSTRFIVEEGDQVENVNVSAMSLSSLNVDVFLHLLKFVKPVDRFNLLLSGTLKGFENVKEGIDLHKRYPDVFDAM